MMKYSMCWEESTIESEYAVVWKSIGLDGI